ncbi:hypothetical protein ACHAXS_000407 [Conticribra weissflogii]
MSRPHGCCFAYLSLPSGNVKEPILPNAPMPQCPWANQWTYKCLWTAITQGTNRPDVPVVAS